MKSFSNIIVVALISLFFSSCSKKDNSDLVQDSTPTGSVSYSFSNAYGVLVAVRSVSYQNVAGFTIPVEVNTATAVFPSAGNSSVFLDAGTVTLNSKTLIKNTNNAYVYQNLADVLTFNQITWNVSGSQDVPPINYTEDKPIPGFQGFETLPAVVNRSQGLTISLGSAVTGSDSVYVIVADYSSKRLMKRVKAGTAECVFSATELSALTAGQGMLQVVPWNYKVEDFSDRDYYFVIESAYTKMNLTIN